MIASERNRNIQGFTLVELSIVLVIIGLLIGGILVGQSLIESSKNLKIIKSAEQYLIAARAFKSKYRYLPGDNPRNGLGNGDGTITHHDTPAYEGMAFFYDLSSIGMTNDKLLKCTNSSCIATTSSQTMLNYLPGGPEKQTHFIVQSMRACAHGNNLVIESFGDYAADASVGLGSSFLLLSRNCTDFTSSVDNRQSCASLTPQRALAIDVKVDDGKPGTGTLVSHNNPASRTFLPEFYRCRNII